MRHLIKSILIPTFVLVISFDSCTNHSDNLVPTKSNSTAEIIRTLKSFYTAWIWEDYLPRNKDNFKQADMRVDSIQKLYCTKRLIDFIDGLNIDDLDYDPFIESNNVDTLMLKYLQIKKDTIQNDIFIVSYIYDNKKRDIKVGVIKDNGVYKIDKLVYLEDRLKPAKTVDRN